MKASINASIKSIIISIVLLVYASNVYAESNIISDKNKSDILFISTVDGIDTIDIERANENGVSHNYYTKFNVSEKGLNINNTLPDHIAKIIINEVTSIDNDNESLLNGNINIKGVPADLIVANPNGIECNGCSFTHSPSTYLTAGYVSYFKDKKNHDAIKLSPAYGSTVNFKAFSNMILPTEKLIVIGHNIKFNNGGYIQGKITLLPGGKGGYIRKNNQFSPFKKLYRNKSDGSIIFTSSNNKIYDFIHFDDLNIINNHNSNIYNIANKLSVTRLNIKSNGNFYNKHGATLNFGNLADKYTYVRR